MRVKRVSCVMADRIAKLRTGVTLPYLEQGAGRSRGRPPSCVGRVAPRVQPRPAEAPRMLRVLVPDQRGHRDASKPPTGYAFTDYIADVEAFLDALGVKAAVIAGSSSGGYVAQGFALAHPDRTRGLVLIGAPRSLQGRAAFADELDGLSDPINRDWVRGTLSWFRFQRPVPADYLEDRVEDGVRMPARVWRRRARRPLSGRRRRPRPALSACRLSSSGARATSCCRRTPESGWRRPFPAPNFGPTRMPDMLSCGSSPIASPRTSPSSPHRESNRRAQGDVRVTRRA